MSVPPGDDRQHQRRRDCQNQHPPLIDTVSDANTDTVSNSHIQADNYSREGPVFHADPLNIWRNINTWMFTAPFGIKHELFICILTQNKGDDSYPCEGHPREKSHDDKHDVWGGERAQNRKQYGPQIRRQEQRSSTVSEEKQCQRNNYKTNII